MFSVLPVFGLLITLALLSSACSDLDLRQTLEGARADSTADSSSLTARSSGNRQDESRPDPQIAAAAFSEIRGTLRRLAAAEETFFAENGTYTDDLSNLGLRADPNIAVRFLRMERDGWGASGTHASLPGRDCVIFVGKPRSRPTTEKYGRRGREGVPVCDDLRASPPPAILPPSGEPARPAQAPKPQAEPPDTANALDLLDPRVLMKVDLRNLVHSQETYFASQGSYARRTESLPLQYVWHKGVRLKILSADAESWSAEATHARLPGKTCVIWFGPVARRPSTQARGAESSGSGVPICD